MMRECGIRFGCCSNAKALTRKSSHRAREFLNAGGAGKGDCLILDVHMPGTSGIELLEAMRRRGDLLPTIIISGRTDAMARTALALPECSRSSINHISPRWFSDLVRLALDQG